MILPNSGVAKKNWWLLCIMTTHTSVNHVITFVNAYVALTVSTSIVCTSYTYFMELNGGALSVKAGVVVIFIFVGVNPVWRNMRHAKGTI